MCPVGDRCEPTHGDLCWRLAALPTTRHELLKTVKKLDIRMMAGEKLETCDDRFHYVDIFSLGYRCRIGLSDKKREELFTSEPGRDTRGRRLRVQPDRSGLDSPLVK